jgi:hypothetical protein
MASRLRPMATAGGMNTHQKAWALMRDGGKNICVCAREMYSGILSRQVIGYFSLIFS